MSDGQLPSRSEDYSGWYHRVIQQAKMVDYGQVKGTMVIRPYGYALWENLQAALDRRFKETGHVNAYFPLFIPYSFIQKEAQHVKGFSPELALVTHAGGEELAEPVVVRPTSETIINHYYSQWIQSWRDLPVLINQWANVVRWELRTRLFLRTTEFLWQEGHTAHATSEEAQEETLRMLGVYADVAVNEAAIPVIVGRKSEIERFAGADDTYTVEAMMGDGKALQAGTSHNLGQNFAKAFDIQYLDQNNELKYVWQTSWGLSTRMVGAIIMAHGDDKGLVMPPRLAPYQVVIIPIWRKDEERDAVLSLVDDVEARLKQGRIRVTSDRDDSHSVGWKFNEWELKGVPIRIEIGPRDVEKNAVVFARRDRPGKEGKQFGIAVDTVVETAREWLEDIQTSMLARATAFRDENIIDVDDYEQFKEVIDNNQWARVWWAGTNEEELRVKEETGATHRLFTMDQPEERGTCFYTGRENAQIALFAKAY